MSDRQQGNPQSLACLAVSSAYEGNLTSDLILLLISNEYALPPHAGSLQALAFMQLCQNMSTSSQILSVHILLIASANLQAEKLRSRAQKSEVWRSNQQLCRYLYFLGRIRAVQLDYTDSKDCLQQALRKVGKLAS